MAIAYLGLGGNLGEPLSTFRRAATMLSQTSTVSIAGYSNIYLSRAVGGPLGQPDYYNAVIAVTCSLEPLQLLDICLKTEFSLGRIRTERWGARTIDIDLLLFGDSVIDKPGLSIPHPELRKRLFVLVPLLDVAPAGMKLPPDGRKLEDLLLSVRADPEFFGQWPIVTAEVGPTFWESKY